jgi:hypothetical protein
MIVNDKHETAWKFPHPRQARWSGQQELLIPTVPTGQFISSYEPPFADLRIRCRCGAAADASLE